MFSTLRIEINEQNLDILFFRPLRLSLPVEDKTGLALLSTWLVAGGLLMPEEGAQVADISVATILARCAEYQATRSSLSLVDRRHFNPGQQAAYRMEAYQSAAVSQWTLNLLTGESNSGRHLATQLGEVVDDRTIDRFLNRSGLRQAEVAGLRQKVGAYLRQLQQTAYWAGVRREPLVGVYDTPPETGWEMATEAEATAALTTAHLVVNGVYKALERLDVPDEGVTSNRRFWHTLLTFLAISGGERLSRVRHFAWERVQGLLGGRKGLSASFLRGRLRRVADAARDETVTVSRGAEQAETISRLQDYQEESIAQRVRRGLVQARAIWLDDLVNGVSRQERIARAWHGTKHWAVKAFRRHIVRDVETKHAITCPLSRSNITPLAVLRQVGSLINGGLSRVEPLRRLGRVITDRWWSNRKCLSHAEGQGPGLVAWGKETKSVRAALDALGPVDEQWEPVRTSPEQEEEVIGWLLDTEAAPYKLQESVRFIALETADGRRLGFFAPGVSPEEAPALALLEELHSRSWVESLLKELNRRMQLPNFGGGAARPVIEEPGLPGLSAPEALRKLFRQRSQARGRQRRAQEKLAAMEAELARRAEQGEETPAPGELSLLSNAELKGLCRRYQGQIERAQARLWELEALIAWYEGRACLISPDPEYELDLSQEAILTQLKLDIHTAHQTLLEEFIEQALKPVLWEEAQRQAEARQRRDARSTASGREGEPLSTDVKELYETKVTNLQRETILHQLLHQGGYFLYHPQERVIVSVAYPFRERRMQAAYERYCVILNRKQVRVPIDRDEEWLLLFTWAERGPPPSGDSNDAPIPPKNHL
jgi:hypothetical protein